MKRLGLVCAFVLVSSAPSFAQEWALFTADAGAGFSAPVYSTGNQLDYGWTLNAGAGIRPIPYLGIKVDFAYNQFDMTRLAANSFGFPRGGERIFSFTLDPILHLNPRGPVDFYLVGGGGVYHRSLDVHGGFFGGGVNPFFFDASDTVVKPGVNGGVGFQFGVRHGIKFYAEARYQDMFTPGRDTTWIPVTFGVRF